VVRRGAKALTARLTPGCRSAIQRSGFVTRQLELAYTASSSQQRHG
jgi:hypothetical protein